MPYNDEHIINEAKSSLDEGLVFSVYLKLMGVDDESIDELFMGNNINSPLRDDDSSPSFGLFRNPKYDDELWFKDFGNESYKGDMIRFAFLCELRYFHHKARTMPDFMLRVVRPPRYDKSLIERIYDRIKQCNIPIKREIKRKKSNTKIKVYPYEVNVDNHEEYSYARSYLFGENIFVTYNEMRELFQRQNIKLVEYLYVNDMFVKKFYNTSHNDLCFAYIAQDSSKTYKIYQPHNKKYKFINNYSSDYTEGMGSLKKYIELYNKHTVIVTKAMKEILFWNNNGFHAVCAKSETQMIKDEDMQYLFDKFNQVLLILDNDPTGIEMMTKYKAKYQDKVKILPFIHAKNVTDGMYKDAMDFVNHIKENYAKDEKDV